MRSRSHAFLFIALLLVASSTARAQFIEDALRPSQSPDAVSARASAMGNAFTAAADDFSALYFNPAGLGLARQSEFALGLNQFGVNNKTTTLGATGEADENGFHLGSIGMVLPFPVARGSLVFSGGYQRLVNFTRASNYGGFNRYSSIIPSLYDDEDERFDLAWNLNLEDTLLTRPTYLNFPIRNNVQQRGEEFETGNLSQWSFGGALEVAPNMFVGLSFNVLSGSYELEREFTETDPSGIHRNVVIPAKDYDAVGFERLTVTENLEQSYSGLNAKIGFLYNHQDVLRLGATVQLPSLLTISESYNKEGVSRFNDGSPYGWSYRLPTLNSEYDISTPWVFTVGAAGRPVDFLLLSADAEIVDYSQLEFDDDRSAHFDALNRDIRKSLRMTTNLRGGAEVRIPGTGLFVRGGFRLDLSPYEADAGTSDYNRTTVSGGIGYLFNETFLLNATFVRSSLKGFGSAYVPPQEQIDAEGIPASAYTLEDETARTWIMVSLRYLF